MEPPAPEELCDCARAVDTRSRPARREIRSARSASRVLDDGVWWWLLGLELWWGKEAPRWPSLMAIVERAESEVVAELGVPLGLVS